MRVSVVGGERRLRVGGRIVWASGDHLGLRFAKSQYAVAEVLRQHQRLQRGGESREPAAASSGDAVRALARMRHAAQALLPGLLRELLVAVPERLLQEADQAGSNTEQAQLFTDMNSLDGLRKSDRLFRAVIQQSEVGVSPNSPDAPPKRLGLVDLDDFERWLESSRTATALDRQFNAQLSALASRIGAFRGVDAPGQLSVPFEPQHFTCALRDLAKELDLGARTRAVLFTQAGRVLGDRLGDFYRRLDIALDEMRAPGSQSPRGVPSHQACPLQMQRERDDPANAAQRGDGALPSAGCAEGGVNRFHANLDPRLLETAARHAREGRRGLATAMMRQANELPDMTDSLRGWLNLLGESLHDQAEADPAFLRDSSHPLREIIDALGHLQMFRPNSNVAFNRDTAQERVDKLLQPIARGDTDPDTVRAVADKLGELTSQQSRRYQQNVKRVVEAAEGRERVRRARRKVIEAINQRYAGRVVPEVLLQLLEAGWRSAMELASLHSANESDALHGQLTLTDVVVAKLGGQAFEQASDTLSDGELLAQIGDELGRAAFDPFRVASVKTRLRRELAALTAPLRTFAALEVPDDDKDHDDSAPPAEGISPIAWERLLACCDALRVGDHLRFVRVETEAVELRVAWIRDDRECYTLVDYRGLRARDMSRRELAVALHRREVIYVPADGRPLGDRAVDAMLSRMEEKLAHQASHDSLTGLINRSQFTAALEQALRRAGGDRGALLWIDIDQFRLVNDAHGYDTGDRLLVDVARLLEQPHGFQLIAHMGADRFAILYPVNGADEALNYAEQLREQVAGMAFGVAGHRLPISISVGVVGLDAEAAAVGPLLQAADGALSAAKAAGGNRVYCYRKDSPEIQNHRESLHWVVRVDEALEHGQLKLRCQPIVPVRPDAGLTSHYEVLLGVTSGQQEALPIAEFIDAAERYNRMRQVDRWVTRTVMEWIATNRTLMPRLQGFAVNLSGQTVSDPAFIDFLRQQLQRTEIDPSWLSFEVTETAAVADLSASAGILQDLKRLGCRIALDDFGSGLASYSYLKELPIDWLKIDGAFVRKIAIDTRDYAVVKSINEIGQFLGKKTIAEYVADQRILHMVVEIGIDYAQGYAIQPPSLMASLVQSLPHAAIADDG
jgi:diguanylate cyclase (GGDEF)-like protein